MEWIEANFAEKIADLNIRSRPGPDRRIFTRRQPKTTYTLIRIPRIHYNPPILAQSP